MAVFNIGYYEDIAQLRTYLMAVFDIGYYEDIAQLRTYYDHDILRRMELGYVRTVHVPCL